MEFKYSLTSGRQLLSLFKERNENEAKSGTVILSLVHSVNLAVGRD